jgi:hypothetical protein
VRSGLPTVGNVLHGCAVYFGGVGHRLREESAVVSDGCITEVKIPLWGFRRCMVVAITRTSKTPLLHYTCRIFASVNRCLADKLYMLWQKFPALFTRNFHRRILLCVYHSLSLFDSRERSVQPENCTDLFILKQGLYLSKPLFKGICR